MKIMIQKQFNKIIKITFSFRRFIQRISNLVYSTIIIFQYSWSQAKLLQLILRDETKITFQSKLKFGIKYQFCFNSHNIHMNKSDVNVNKTQNERWFVKLIIQKRSMKWLIKSFCKALRFVQNKLNWRRPESANGINKLSRFKLRTYVFQRTKL